MIGAGYRLGFGAEGESEWVFRKSSRRPFFLSGITRGTYLNAAKEPKRLPAGSGIAIGVAIGLGIGAAMGNVGVGLAIGVAVGVAIDAAMRRNRK